MHYSGGMSWCSRLQLLLSSTTHLNHVSLVSSARCEVNQCPVHAEIHPYKSNERPVHSLIQQRRSVDSEKYNGDEVYSSFVLDNETVLEKLGPRRTGDLNMYDVLALTKLYAAGALGKSWRIQLWAGLGLLSLLVFLMFVSTRVDKSRIAWHVGLTIAIALSWVGITQLARAALTAGTDNSGKSLVHLIVWANGTMWVFLGIPHIIQRWRAAQFVSSNSIWDLCRSEVFGWRHAIMFWCMAFATNAAYIAALSFLPASLNTAVFSSTSVFAFGLTLAFLEKDLRSRGIPRGKIVCIGLSVLGVVLISEGWHHNVTSFRLTDRLAGVSLSLVAAFGTAAYQVTFKYIFVSGMTPEVVGLFLAYLGAVTFACYGSIIFGGAAVGVISIDLSTVPWKLILLTSISSAIFNFLIKFGIVYTSPITVSLATQLGIPLNLVLDLLIVGAMIDATQSTGVLIMLVSFSLNAYLEQSARQ